MELAVTSPPATPKGCLPPPTPQRAMFSSPGIGLGIYRKIVPLSSNYLQTRFQSLIKMTSQPKWLEEKNRINKLDKKNKRELYKSKDYDNLDRVQPWAKYAVMNKSLEFKKHNLEDLEEFKKIKINPDMNKILSEKVSIWPGNITKLEIDAIVNAANSRLKAGGGVDRAIHEAAGPFLQQECDSLGGCATGDAKITGGYNLPAQYVIHTVGPQDGSESKLQSCYDKCFALANEHQLSSIAFPCISTGVYGFPNRLAAHIALRTARKVLETSKNLERVIFCTFLPVDIEIYETLMQIYFPLHEWNYNDGASATE